MISRLDSGRTARDYTIVVAYDGEKTEDEYFRGWALVIPPSRLTIVPLFIKSGGNPLIAVEKAEKKLRKFKNYAEFWCVSDCDGAAPQCVSQAWERAQRSGIRLCLSNRCFEIWLALHFERSAKPITSEQEAVAAINKHVPQFSCDNKAVPFAKLLPLTNDAILNAEWLANQGCNNPSTNVHGLVRKLNSNLT